MMVPRSFVPLSTAKRRARDLNEKDDGQTSRRLVEQAAAFEAGASRLRSTSPKATAAPSAAPTNPKSDPVRIPTQRRRRPALDSARPAPSTSSLSQRSLPTTAIASEPRRISSAHDLLTATTIPLRRRPIGRRLPAGDHVAEFSRLLLDDVKPGSDGSLSGSLSNPQFDGLFGNIDELVEGQMFVGSEGVDASILSTRSVSSESVPSVGSSDDFASNDLPTFSSPERRTADKRLRQIASSEGCDDNHPLLYIQERETPISSSPELSTPRNLSPSRGRRLPTGEPSNTFKSSLSASLRALKLAAQSVSNIASSPPIIQPDDFLHDSFFRIQPGLTDDKRPPPSTEVPSPELRRYLNPNSLPIPSDSPAQLHIWHDERPSRRSSSSPKAPSRRSKHNPKSRSPSPPKNIPLQSCIPPTVRTANASAPPIWLSADGNPSNKRTVGHNRPQAVPGPDAVRQREPRENPDFLRVLVAEMNMRRAGKFEADATGRARMWIEARSGTMESKRKAEERWVVWSAEEEEI